jgi:plasmid stability protein
MANLQVKDIDDQLYQALKSRAKREDRSVGHEVIRIIKEYLNQPKDTGTNATDQFLSLSWHSNDEESADDLIQSLQKDRTE